MRLDTSLLALVALTSAWLGAWLTVRVMGWRQRVAGRDHNTRGKRGETEAASLLEQHGFRIVERQQRIRYAITVDGAPREVPLVLDFVVERAGERFVAEVKTAGAAALSRETRRQLLEYQLATGHRTLLVDPERGALTVLDFPRDAQQAQASSAQALAFQRRAITLLLLGVLSLLGYAAWRSLLRLP